MEFLNRNAGAIQALSAVLTVLLALAALIGVKVQIDAAERIQKGQSARDIYREFLNLSVANPKFSQPDYCALKNSPDQGAYESYVGYMLYGAEQLLAVGEDWKDVILEDMSVHTQFICAMEETDIGLHATEVEQLLNQFRGDHCSAVKACG